MNTVSLADLKKSPISRGRAIISIRVIKWGLTLFFYYRTVSIRKLINKIPVVENKPAMVLLFCLSYLLMILFFPHSYKLGNTRIDEEITGFSHVACTFLCPCDSSQFHYCHNFKSSTPRVWRHGTSDASVAMPSHIWPPGHKQDCTCSLLRWSPFNLEYPRCLLQQQRAVVVEP